MPSYDALVWHYYEYTEGIGCYRTDNGVIDSLPKIIDEAVQSVGSIWYQVEFD
jgi:hypothetical protein